MPVTDRPALVKSMLERFRRDRLPAGAKLPGERELAATLGASRSSVREVLGVLEVLRIVERRPQPGIYLRELDSESSIEVLVLQEELALSPTDLDFEQAQEARIIQEMEAIRLAAQRRTATDLVRLRDVLARSRAHFANGENLARDDEEFHLAFIAAARNSILLRMSRALYLMSRSVRRGYFDVPGHAEISLQQHERILACLELGDAEAAVMAIKEHYAQSSARWRSLTWPPHGR